MRRSKRAFRFNVTSGCRRLARRAPSFMRFLIRVVGLVSVVVMTNSLWGYDNGPVGASGWRFSEVLGRSDGSDACGSGGLRYRGDLGERGHDRRGPWPV